MASQAILDTVFRVMLTFSPWKAIFGAGGSWYTLFRSSSTVTV